MGSHAKDYSYTILGHSRGGPSSFLETPTTKHSKFPSKIVIQPQLRCESQIVQPPWAKFYVRSCCVFIPRFDLKIGALQSDLARLHAKCPPTIVFASLYLHGCVGCYSLRHSKSWTSLFGTLVATSMCKREADRLDAPPTNDKRRLP